MKAGAARFGRRKPGNPLPWYAAPSNRRPPTGEKERAHRGGCTLTVIDRGKNLSRQQYLAVLAEQRNCGGPSPIRSSSISRSRLRASARRACGCGRSSCPRSSTTGGRRLSTTSSGTFPAAIALGSMGISRPRCLFRLGRRFVARISSRAKSAPRMHFHERRTYSGRPSSSMWFSEATAMATSVVCRPSVRERSASPGTLRDLL